MFLSSFYPELKDELRRVYLCDFSRASGKRITLLNHLCGDCLFVNVQLVLG